MRAVLRAPLKALLWIAGAHLPLAKWEKRRVPPVVRLGGRPVDSCPSEERPGGMKPPPSASPPLTLPDEGDNHLNQDHEWPDLVTTNDDAPPAANDDTWPELVGAKAACASQRDSSTQPRRTSGASA